METLPLNSTGIDSSVTGFRAGGPRIGRKRRGGKLERKQLFTDHMGNTPFTIVLADDEPRIRLLIRGFLHEEPGVEVVGEASDGPRAIALMRERRPDLALLDSRLPRLNALEVLSKMGSRTLPVIIFMSSGGEREPDALLRGESGWIPKPVTRDSLRKALARAREHLAGRWGRGSTQFPSEGRIAVKSGSRVLMLDLDSIAHIAAANNHCRIITHQREVTVRENLSSLAARLPQDLFLQVNRSSVINMGAVRALESKSHGDWIVRLTDGVQYVVSRTRRPAVLRRLQVLGLK